MMNAFKRKWIFPAVFFLLLCFMWGLFAPRAEANMIDRIKQFWNLPVEVDKIVDEYAELKQQYDVTLQQLEDNRQQLENHRRQLERNAQETSEALAQLNQSNQMLSDENAELHSQNRELLQQIADLQQDAAKKSAFARRWITFLFTVCGLVLGYYLFARGIRYILRN